MRVYLVRHAIAYNRDPEAWPSDRDRPLTDAGVKKFRRAARGLQQFVPEVDTVLSSRLTRAWQTAGILMEEASWPAAVACAALEPGHPAPEAVAALRAHATAAGVALVGHEPLLSELASYLLTGDEAHVRLEMKKGGVACLDCGAGQGAPEPGSATLYWLATPKMLRAMRECG